MCNTLNNEHRSQITEIQLNAFARNGFNEWKMRIKIKWKSKNTKLMASDEKQHQLTQSKARVLQANIILLARFRQLDHGIRFYCAN